MGNPPCRLYLHRAWNSSESCDVRIAETREVFFQEVVEALVEASMADSTGFKAVHVLMVPGSSFTGFKMA